MSELEYIVDEQGNKTKVIMPLAEYERLLEDLHDLAFIAERRNGETMSLDAFRTEVGRIHG